MKDSIIRTGGTWTQGNQYELSDLLEVMRIIRKIITPHTLHIRMVRLLFIYHPVRLESSSGHEIVMNHFEVMIIITMLLVKN